MAAERTGGLKMRRRSVTSGAAGERSTGPSAQHSRASPAVFSSALCGAAAPQASMRRSDRLKPVLKLQGVPSLFR